MAVLAAAWAYSAADLLLRQRAAYRRGQEELAAGRPAAAAAWLESASRDLVPPQSPWSRRARELLPEAREQAERRAADEARWASRAP